MLFVGSCGFFCEIYIDFVEENGVRLAKELRVEPRCAAPNAFSCGASYLCTALSDALHVR